MTTQNDVNAVEAVVEAAAVTETKKKRSKKKIAAANVVEAAQATETPAVEAAAPEAETVVEEAPAPEPMPEPYTILGFQPDGGRGSMVKAALPVEVTDENRAHLLEEAERLLSLANGADVGIPRKALWAQIRTYRPATKEDGTKAFGLPTPMDEDMNAIRAAHRIINQVRKAAGLKTVKEFSGGFGSYEDTKLRAAALQAAWAQITDLTPPAEVVAPVDAAADAAAEML